MAFRGTRILLALCWLGGCVGPEVGWAAPDTASPPVLPAGFLEGALRDDKTLNLTLPDGRRVVGKIGRMEKSEGRVTQVEGLVQHPEPGTFHFERRTVDGQDNLTGSLRFSARPTQWKIVPAEGASGFRFAEAPADDAFRPPVQAMPTTPGQTVKPTPSRDQSEAALREGLSIEETAPGKVRVGTVEIDRTARTIRIPAKVNLRGGDVEYVLVHSQGKCHESVFATDSSPRDIHIALLLLGLKPAVLPAVDKPCLVTPSSGVRIRAEWEEQGQTKSVPLAETIVLGDGTKPDPETDFFWLGNGSRFTEAGFGAVVEGSIVSLIQDDMALINNPRPDRSDDTLHHPNSKILPPLGAAASIVLHFPKPASSSNP